MGINPWKFQTSKSQIHIDIQHLLKTCTFYTNYYTYYRRRQMLKIYEFWILDFELLSLKFSEFDPNEIFNLM